MVATRETGEVRRTSKQLLKKYDLDPERVEDVKKRLEELAGGKDWTLEVVENNGVIKFQGVVDADDDDEWAAEVEMNTRSSTPKQNRKDESLSHDEETQSHDSSRAGGESRDGSNTERTVSSERKSEEPEGSEETFKDEL